MRKGSHHTLATRKKHSIAVTGEKNPMYGKHRSEEEKEQTRERMKGNAFFRGHHHTEEVRRNQRERSMGNTNMLGHHHTKESKRKSRESNKGKKRSGETRMKMCENHADVSGKNNPNYINGKSNDPYPIEFNDTLKELIRYRDGYRCQKCGKHQSELPTQLHVHHIDHNPENNLPSNLITLCLSCNSNANSRVNRTAWQTYFEKRVVEIIYKEVVKCQD